MKTEGATCIDCHQNLVHEEVPMTDLNASLAAGKMVLKPDEDEDEDEDEEDDEDDEGEGEDSASDEADSEDEDEDDDEE